MNKIFLFSSILFFLFLSGVIYAHCPLCTMAVGAGAVASEHYGLDKSIIGLLIGAFAVSTGLWFGLKIKKEYFKFQLSSVVLFSFLFTVIPLLGVMENDSFYLPLLFGSFFNKVYFVNKMLFGSVIGALVCLVGYFMHKKIKEKRGKVLFSFQGVAITLFLLLITGLIFYFIF